MRDSGLLELLLDDFTNQHDIRVEYVAVGTGAAIELGKNNDVDAILVHAPDLESNFIEQGYGVERITFTWNRFVLLSYEEFNDSIVDAFAQLESSEQCFISRGDFSGTHHKEQQIWIEANTSHEIQLIEGENGIHPEGEWYNSIGQGMGAAINMAYEKGCTTLSDRGTALNFLDKTDLTMHEFNDTILDNPYSFIPVTGSQHQHTKAFGEYLLGDGQDIINSYTINGEHAFFKI